MRNYFILNGVDSREYGVYINGQGTFGAPKKAYNYYNVPGRNGALLGNEHRLENISVSYEAFIYTNFSENLAAFRSFLLSLNGYTRLSDSYHPDEFRLAVYEGPMDPEVTRMNDAGSFVITFSCKPQRFLYSGETVYNWLNQTLSGSELTLEAKKVDPSYLQWSVEVINHRVSMTSRSAPSPSYTTQILSVSKCVIDYRDENGLPVFDKSYDQPLNHAVTNARANMISGILTIYSEVITSPTTGWAKYSDNVYRVSVSNWSAVLASLRTEVSGASTRPENYAYTVKASVNDLASESYACCLSGGYYYVKDVDYSTASAFQTAKGGHKVDVRYTSAVTASITPYVPNYQTTGYFTLAGSLSYQYSAYDELIYARYTYSDYMSNPTVFDSEPLIRAYGNGSFTMDGVTITITNATSYTDIDCEMMDCYEGTTNRNNDVTFSTYDFPKLRPGDNAVTIVTGITALEITPRWWRV